MKKLLIILATLLIGSPISAQDNIFLDKNFWATKPTVETIDLKMKEGNDIAQANANNFDGVTQAILQDAPNASIEHAISQKGNDVNKLTHDGRTYIFWAAYKGNLDLVQFLIDHGAKTDITDDKGSSILNFAAASGQKNTKIYDLLLKHGANLHKDLTPYGANALLLIAPHDNDLSMITYFTAKGLDLHSKDAQGNGIFNYVAKTGNKALMKQLLLKGVKGNDNAFIFASQGARGHTNGLAVYKFLDSLGLNPTATSSEGETAIHILANRSKDKDVIHYFIEKGANVNQPDSFGNTPFMNAASRNSLENVSLLAKSVKNINQRNKKGESALSLAVAHNSPDVVEFLLSIKATTKVVDNNGNDLSVYLMQSYSAKKEDDFNKKLSVLKKNGLKFGQPQADGSTLYHLALDKNDLQTLQFIQQFKPNVNGKNKEGITPLHKAAMKAQNIELLTYLLSIGAKKEALTEYDETAYDLASENELLLQQNISLEFLK